MPEYSEENARRAKALAYHAQQAETRGFVHAMAAGTARGYWLLAREGLDLCAVRFVQWRRGHDARSYWFFRTGEESTYATYEWVAQQDGSGDLTKPNVQTGRGEASDKAAWGLGHVLFLGGGGNPFVQCGPFTLFWMFPNSVHFPHGAWSPEKRPVELAPTGWNTLEEVMEHFERIKWYRYQTERGETVEFSMDELRGGDDSEK